MSFLLFFMQLFCFKFKSRNLKKNFQIINNSKIFSRAKSELKTVMETPVGRPRSLMAPSASPEAFATNPLLPVTEVQTAPLISESVQKLLKAQYDELKQNGY